MSKKLFAILLAVVLVFSVLAVGATAAGTAKGDEWMTVSITTDKGADSYQAGENVIVNVTIACNYNATSLRFPILYDADVLEPKTGITVDAYGTCASAGSVSSNEIFDGSCTPESYDGNWGCILVQWIANVGNGAVGCINNPNGELAFSFELRTKSNSAGKTGTILIPEDSDKLYYQAIEDPEIATSFYYMSADTCAMTFNPANVTVALADVKLIPNAAYNSPAVILEDNLLVYGLRTGMLSPAEVRTFVTATGGATIQVNSSELGYGTGSTIDLKVGGSVVKTYTIFVYGDLDGDCDVTVSDVLLFLSYYGGAARETALVHNAADVVPDGDLDPLDLTKMVSAYGGDSIIDQTTAPFAV